MSTNPFHRPAASSGIQWEDLLGKLLLIEPHSYEAEITTVHGKKDAVRADVTVIDADGQPEEYKDTLIFPGVLITQTRSLMGEKVLGRLIQGVPKPGQNPPWKIDDPTEADVEAGVRYLESRKQDHPFAAAAKSEAPF